MNRKIMNCVMKTLALTTIVFAVSVFSISSTMAGSKGLIKIAENDWTSQLVDINLAKIILEEQMGYDVELIFVDYSAQWVGMANGDIDVAMEIWPFSATEAIKEWVDEKGKVMKIGPLGATGFTGWWVPTYVIKGDPKRGIKAVAPNLKNWEQLNDYAHVFARPETGDKGFCIDSVASWDNKNSKRIPALGINYVNVYAGAEGPLLAEIRGAYQKGEPLLICDMWSPHWIFSEFDLTRITLPAYSDECYGRVEGGPEATYACDFPVEALYNVARTGFDKEQPEVFQFIKNIQLSNADQEEMMFNIDVDGMKVDAAVRKWMAANTSKWQSWIPN